MIELLNDDKVASSPPPERPHADARDPSVESRPGDAVPAELRKSEERPGPPESRDGSSEPQSPQPSFLRRHRTAIAVAALVTVVLAALGAIYWDYARHFEATDDAFVDSRQFAVAPKVAGYVVAVPVTDNQHVDAGAVIARIDDRDYRIALEQAQAQVSAAQAAIANIDAQIQGQQSQVGEAQAQVQQSQAALTFAQQEAARYRDLAQRGAGTVQQSQQSGSNLQQQQANLARTQAGVNAAQQQIDALRAQRASAEANLAQAKAQQEQAVLNVGYTTVTAAQPGRVVRLTGAVGQFASAGAALSMFVPDEIWVTANYKETQLALMRPGQPADISIDAYPGRLIHGRVDSVQPGSGTAFSLLPAENATGNYVKIVQRVPVKITMADPPTDVALGPGMSVVPTVRVRPDPSFYERLTGRNP